jgi:epsin
MFSAQEYKKIMKESTSNENWNVSNSKLQVLADHTYNWEDYNVIMKHLWAKLQSKPKEYRRIFKALAVMDYLVKNGAPRVVQDIKDDLYKIRTFKDFSYTENGTDHGQGGKCFMPFLNFCRVIS